MTTLRIGTRGSQLALYQANTVARLLTDAGGPPCELVIIKTSGDILHVRPSGNAPELRCYAEARDAATAERLCGTCLSRLAGLLTCKSP